MSRENPFEQQPAAPQTPDNKSKRVEDVVKAEESEKIDLEKIPPDRAFEYVKRLEQNALHEREQKAAKYGPHYAGPPPKELIEIDRQLLAIRKVGIDLRYMASGQQLEGEPNTVAGLLRKYEAELEEDRELERKKQEAGNPPSTVATEPSERQVAILKGLER